MSMGSEFELNVNLIGISGLNPRDSVYRKCTLFPTPPHPVFLYFPIFTYISFFEFVLIYWYHVF